MSEIHSKEMKGERNAHLDTERLQIPPASVRSAYCRMRRVKVGRVRGRGEVWDDEFAGCSGCLSFKLRELQGCALGKGRLQERNEDAQ